MITIPPYASATLDAHAALFWFERVTNITNLQAPKLVQDIMENVETQLNLPTPAPWDGSRHSPHLIRQALFMLESDPSLLTPEVRERLEALTKTLATP